MPEYLTRSELAAALKVSVKTLRRLDRDGTGPRPVHLSTRITRYESSEVAAFMSAHGLSAPAEIEAARHG